MPKRFQFRLEPLLRLRKSLEQEAQRQLAKEMDARNQVEAHMKELQDNHQRALESRRCKPGDAIDLRQWAYLERYLLVMEKRIIQARMDLDEAEKRVTQARLNLAKAHRDHLTLMRLKERRQIEHEREIYLQEIRESDEIAVLRYRFATAAPATLE